MANLLENCKRLDYSPDQPRDENGRWGEGSGTHKEGKIRSVLEKAKAAGSFGEHHAAFVKALETSDYDSAKPPAAPAFRGPFDLNAEVHYNAEVEGAQSIYAKFAREADRVAKEAGATHVKVREITKAGKVGKPVDLPKGDIDTPWREGTHILTERAEIRGHGFDTDKRPGATFSVATRDIGSETHSGTIVAKRMVGDKIQYAVKPRSPKAEKAYQTAREQAARLVHDS